MIRTRVFWALAPVAVLATMAAPARAHAQPPADGGSQAEGTDSSGSKGKKKLNLDDDFLVEGKLEKPNAFQVLRRASMDYDWARLDAKFVPLVLESVQDPLF